MIFLLTVFTVSLDAYVASLAYNLKRKLNFWELFYAGAFTFFVSLLALSCNEILRTYISFIKEIGACVFLLLGLKNYYSFFSNEDKNVEYGSVTMLGIGVSIDAGIACLTTDIVYSTFLCATVMFLGHFSFLLLGGFTAKAVKIVKKMSLYSGIVLMILGILKLLF